MLLEMGAISWSPDRRYRSTCLHHAASKGHVEVIKAVALWSRQRGGLEPARLQNATTGCGCLGNGIDLNEDNQGRSVQPFPLQPSSRDMTCWFICTQLQI
jgi:hypothetical protein